MDLSLLSNIGEIIVEYGKDPNFLLTCIATFFICDALFKAKRLEKYLSMKELVSVVVGAGLGVVVIAPTALGAIFGAVAGGVTTLGVKRLDQWAGKVNTKPDA